LVISLLSSMVRKRRDGVYGLNVLIGIGASTYPLLCSAKFSATALLFRFT
jgi:hypothetical protein